MRTFAEGLFSRLAHDLELTCTRPTGHADVDRDASTATISIDVPLDRLEVRGTVRKDGSVDVDGLTASDRRDVLAKMKSDVFHASGGVITINAKLESDGKARVTVTPPNGNALDKTITPQSLKLEESACTASGKVDVSLHALGSDTVKGPMNAFRVKDGVEVHFNVTFVPAQD